MSQLQVLIELQKNVTCQIEKTRFESRSEPEVFSGLCSSSVTAAIALMTVITQLLLWTKLISPCTNVFLRQLGIIKNISVA